MHSNGCILHIYPTYILHSYMFSHSLLIHFVVLRNVSYSVMGVCAKRYSVCFYDDLFSQIIIYYIMTVWLVV